MCGCAWQDDDGEMVRHEREGASERERRGAMDKSRSRAQESQIELKGRRPTDDSKS